MRLDKRQRRSFKWNPRTGAELEAKSWGPLATLGLGAIAAVGSQVPALLACFCWGAVTPAHWAEMASNAVAVIMLVCISTPVQVGLLMWFARKAGSTALSYLALTLPSRRSIGVLAAAALVIVVICDGAAELFGRQLVTPFQTDIYRSARTADALPWLWLTIVIVAPIGEETLFRGFLFRGWQRSLSSGPWIAIGATALLWAIIHVQYNALVIGQVLLVGLAFGWVRWATGSTVSTILLHAVLNAVGMTETYFALRG